MRFRGSKLGLPLLALLGLHSFDAAAVCPDSPRPVSTPAEQYPATPLTYPRTSDRYAVQYEVNGRGRTHGQVYVSEYGGTDASPARQDSGYPPRTSMSFVSIPAGAGARVELRVRKLSGGPFQRGDHVSIRPSVKPIEVETLDDGSVRIAVFTPRDFRGDQFLLWWEGAAVDGLALLLDPLYAPPQGNVLVVQHPADLEGIPAGTDALDFEGIVATDPPSAHVFVIPTSIQTVFLGPGAWVQGKLRFETRGSAQRKLYGPGVLDVSRFRYDQRTCDSSSAFPDEGLYALTADDPNSVLDHFTIDGIVIADHNHAASDSLYNGSFNDVKTLGWNGENAALRLGDNATASNVCIRSGDDSLMMWGAGVTVENATVWQNYNGGVVNLGWANNSTADGNVLDGLYVVKTDWTIPAAPSWIALPPTNHPLQGQNNAVFASLVTPGTSYGRTTPPVYRNIFVEDSPLVLFSLKVLPPICSPTFLVCPGATLTDPSFVHLEIENLFTPPSLVGNSIGFQTLPPGYEQGDGQKFPDGLTLGGEMQVGLTNVFLRHHEAWVPLTRGTARSPGKVSTNGKNVDVIYRHDAPGRDHD
jgi:hypothetical protein